MVLGCSLPRRSWFVLGVELSFPLFQKYLCFEARRVHEEAGTQQASFPSKFPTIIRSLASFLPMDRFLVMGCTEIICCCDSFGQIL